MPRVDNPADLQTTVNQTVEEVDENNPQRQDLIESGEQTNGLVHSRKRKQPFDNGTENEPIKRDISVTDPNTRLVAAKPVTVGLVNKISATPGMDSFLEYITAFVQHTYPSWSLEVGLSYEEATSLAVAAKKSGCLRSCVNLSLRMCSDSVRDMAGFINILKILARFEQTDRAANKILGGSFILKILDQIRQTYS
jgi:hypothetical protein